jgi:serine/threonine-protein kinase
MSPSSSRPRRLALLLAATIAIGSLPFAAQAASPSDADKAAAGDYMRDGKDLRAKNDHAGALKKFRAAYGLVPSPVTGVAVAQEEIALGLLVEARETLAAVERMPVSATETEFGKQAREDAAKLLADLLPRIPIVEIAVKGAPAGQAVTIAIDGKDVPLDAAETGWRVNPGTHAIVTKTPGRADKSTSVTVKERERRKVEVAFAATSATSAGGTAPELARKDAVPSLAADASSGDGTRIIGLVVGGTGLVAMGIGGIVGLSAKSSWSNAKTDHCGTGICDEEGKRLTDDAHSLGNKATIVVGIGAALAVGGVVLWLTAPSGEKKPGVTHVGVGPGSISIGGRF